MSHPYPDLQFHPNSGLSFEWAEDYTSGVWSSSSFHLGPDGIGVGFVMWINWEDLETAVTELLGYSYRVPSTFLTITNVSLGLPAPIVITTALPHGLTTGMFVVIASVNGNSAANGTWQATVLTANTFSIPQTGDRTTYINGGIVLRQPMMSRLLPWQHPYFNQLVVKAITEVKGAVLQGTSEVNQVDLFNPNLGGAGVGAVVNTGPWSEFVLAKITMAFWRPPYFLRSDASIMDENGNPQEWLRYVGKHWETTTQLLTQEGNCFNWAIGMNTDGKPQQGIFNSTGPPGSIGKPVTHTKVTRRWYQVPEACLFSTDWPGDGTPGGQATNLLYTQTATTNPITNYVYLQGSPMSPCVNSPIGGGVNDSNPRLRMWGCYMGTLRFDAFEIIERDLQLPPYLMQIPSFAANEAISQQQYDVVFHFDLHDPPRSPGIAQSEFTIPTTPVAAIVNQAYRGHNLVPFSGDGQFYAIVSRNNVAGTNTTGTIFNYADFSDLFKVQ